MQRFKKAKVMWLKHFISPWGSDYTLRDRKHGDTAIASFCADDFERITGIRMEQGEVVKVTITVEAV